MSERFAGDGEIWVCAACGKTAKDQYGIEGEHSYGWDESCTINSVLCHYPKTGDTWEAFQGQGAAASHENTSAHNGALGASAAEQ